MDLLVIAPPLGRVAVVRVDVLESNREVDEEEVKVVDPPEAELLLRERMYLMTSVNTKLSRYGERHVRAHERGKCSRAMIGFCSKLQIYGSNTTVPWR